MSCLSGKTQEPPVPSRPVPRSPAGRPRYAEMQGGQPVLFPWGTGSAGYVLLEATPLLPGWNAAQRRQAVSAGKSFKPNPPWTVLGCRCRAASSHSAAHAVSGGRRAGIVLDIYITLQPPAREKAANITIVAVSAYKSSYLLKHVFPASALGLNFHDYLHKNTDFLPSFSYLSSLCLYFATVHFAPKKCGKKQECCPFTAWALTKRGMQLKPQELVPQNSSEIKRRACHRQRNQPRSCRCHSAHREQRVTFQTANQPCPRTNSKRQLTPANAQRSCLQIIIFGACCVWGNHVLINQSCPDHFGKLETDYLVVIACHENVSEKLILQAQAHAKDANT